MTRYRIKEYDYVTHKSYVVQRKSIFGWWYNPDNVDAYRTGWYDTIEEAEEELAKKAIKTKTKIIYEVTIS